MLAVLDGQALGDEAVSMNQSKAQTELDGMLSDWMANAKVETTEVFDTLDIPAYYANMKALRAEIAAMDQPQQ